jgi:hypothetical protein
MTIFSKHKFTMMAALALLLGSHSGITQAANGTPGPGYNPPPAAYGGGGYPPPQNYGPGPGYGGPGYGGPSFNGPWNNRGGGFSGPWNNRGGGFSGPWNNRGGGFSGPWNNRGGGFNGPWNNRGGGFNGPWNNRGSSFGPFGNPGGWGNGGRNPFGPRGPAQWFSPNKNDLSNNWDDMLNAPSRMGRMPGGWEAPSVSVPNPIDVGDEFSDAARDLPDQMDNFRYNN